MSAIDILKSIAKKYHFQDTLLFDIYLCLQRFWLVDLGWIIRLKLKNYFSKKVRVGFGPVITGERTLGGRKWHIDPIVETINQTSTKYVADIFFRNEDLARFDIVGKGCIPY